ncbi:hypothetical protein CERSUDRAFT_51707 [Gelatoporia subvermispora B]|uniref:Uncharacterized protein n=1 Tax=Ceriporiopsis subvermispora (strain B) TaxID=914234 RepID=M2QI94_CERS8|nr:hypothetical protein CERSUDRAFT_51707 [Gelatoporia subvermispora B]
MALLRDIARRAIDIFSSLGLQSCLIGGVACTLYGVQRVPNDVDLVVLTSTYSQETLKQMLCTRDPKFFTVASKKVFASYRVLWYGFPMRQCKVDILLPGIMNIPRPPTDKIEHISGFPLMPLLPLLMLKVQAWEDHRNHYERYMQDKQYTDSSDIRLLLRIARREGSIRYGDPVNRWIPSSLVEETKRRVELWVDELGSYETDDWTAIGFKPPARSQKFTTDDRLSDLMRSMRIRNF